MSRTVDTSDAALLSALGTYLDDVHYVSDTSGNARYASHVVGIFIFLSEQERAFIIDKDKLLKIIKTFLPVHVRVDIVLVEEVEEIYPADNMADEYESALASVHDESVARVAGVYQDAMSWGTFFSWHTDRPDGRTNDPRFRTPHPFLEAERPA